MRQPFAVVPLLVWLGGAGLARSQAAIVGPRDPTPPLAPPGLLPLGRGEEQEPIGPLEADGARLVDLLALVGERDGLNILAEVYPGTQWDQALDVSLPGGDSHEVLAAVAKAYRCEYGCYHGVHLLRKERPWEQPQISADIDGGDLALTRRLWDDQGPCDTVADLSCDRAPLSLVLRKHAEWTPDDLPRHLRTHHKPMQVLAHPDFVDRRLFARIRELPAGDFVLALAACIGADYAGPDFALLIRSPGMAWRAAEADYIENGPPDFDQYLRETDPAFVPFAPRHRLQGVLLLELLRKVSPFEAGRLSRGLPVWPEAAAEIKELDPMRYLVQEYPTVTFGFEELSRFAQLAVIACIEEGDEGHPPQVRFDRMRPDLIVVTLRRSAGPEGSIGPVECVVSYPLADGKTTMNR